MTFTKVDSSSAHSWLRLARLSAATRRPRPSASKRFHPVGQVRPSEQEKSMPLRSSAPCRPGKHPHPIAKSAKKTLRSSPTHSWRSGPSNDPTWVAPNVDAWGRAVDPFRLCSRAALVTVPRRARCSPRAGWRCLRGRWVRGVAALRASASVARSVRRWRGGRGSHRAAGSATSA